MGVMTEDRLDRPGVAVGVMVPSSSSSMKGAVMLRDMGKFCIGRGGIDAVDAKAGGLPRE